MTADKLFGALSLTRKAGKLIGGFDAVCESAAKGEAKLVFLASDAAPRTQKNVRAAVTTCEVREIALTQTEIAAIMQKLVGVLAVADEGLAALCLKALEAQ